MRTCYGSCVQEKYGGAKNLVMQSNSEVIVRGDAGQHLTELIVTAPLPMEKGQPLVRDWDCLRVNIYIHYSGTASFVLPSAVLKPR